MFSCVATLYNVANLSVIIQIANFNCTKECKKFSWELFPHLIENFGPVKGSEIYRIIEIKAF